jgi:uncharacterized membrane protein
VVTVLVATDGKLDIPNINSQQSLRTALNRLGSLRSDQVLLVSIAWHHDPELVSCVQSAHLLCKWRLCQALDVYSVI